jgi:hypothetical protein
MLRRGVHGRDFLNQNCGAGAKSWQINRTENCGELTFHSPPPTPLLPAPTLSRRVGLLASQSTRSSLEAQNGLPLFLGVFLETPCRVAMVEPPGTVYLIIACSQLFLLNSCAYNLASSSAAYLADFILTHSPKLPLHSFYESSLRAGSVKVKDWNRR